MEGKRNLKSKRRSRHCLSWDDSMIEKNFQESYHQQISCNVNINKSMNSLGPDANQELIRFLRKKDPDLQTSELCKIAREINSSQLEDSILNSTNKFQLLQTTKYHSWPKHFRTYNTNKSTRKYHNYGLKEEQETTEEDFLTVVQSGLRTDRSWTSPSELSIQNDSDLLYKENVVTKSLSCEELASYPSTTSHCKRFSSLRNLSKIDSEISITENLEGIINNDFKSKFNLSIPQQQNEHLRKKSDCGLSKAEQDFNEVYYSVFKHDIIIDEDDVSTETPHIPEKQHVATSRSTASLSCPLKNENKTGNVSMLSLDVSANHSVSSCSLGSDSGVGNYSDLLPLSNTLDHGVDPPLFKKRSDMMMQWFSGFSNEQKNILIQRILEGSCLPQMHMLSLKMENQLHKDCPINCRDMLQWLPENVVYQILDYLKPVSLSRACQVNRTWHTYSMHNHLWQKFCRHDDYQLSNLRHREQILKHTSQDGVIQWRDAFIERYCLRQNWMNGKCKVKTLLGHTQGVSCVQFDQRRIVSGSSDKTIRVWDLTSESTDPVLHLVGHSGTVRCLQLIGNRLVSGSADTTIKVWDLSVGSDWNMAGCRVTMVGHFDTVRCLQVDSDKVISGSYDKTLKVWDLMTGHCKLTLRGHSGAVLCVQFDDQKIVSGSSDKTIKVWSLFTGVCLASFRGHDDAVTCLQFNHSHVISGSLDCTLKFWNLNTGQCIGTIDWIRSEGHTRVVRCLQVDRWKIVSAGDDKTLKIWSLESGERFVTLHNHTDGVTCLRFDDYMIVSGSYDKTVKVWDFLP